MCLIKGQTTIPSPMGYTICTHVHVYMRLCGLRATQSAHMHLCGLLEVEGVQVLNESYKSRSI